MYSDPIADMLTRIRNGLMAGKTIVEIPNSKFKAEIARVLQEEGYIEAYGTETTGSFPILNVTLQYYGDRRNRRPVITGLERVSKPGCRIYTKREDIPWVKAGMGTVILSTPRGVVSGRQARSLGVGGEVLCKVW